MFGASRMKRLPATGGLLNPNRIMPKRTTTSDCALKGRGELDEAIACYGRALDLKPDYAEAHNNLGIAFHQQGNLIQALVSYRLVHRS